MTEETPVEDIELTPEELAESQESARQLGERMLLGDGADPASVSVKARVGGIGVSASDGCDPQAAP